MVEKCLLVLGLGKGWVVIRRLWSLDTLLISWGGNKIVLFDLRINLDDQDINLMITN